MKETVYNLLAWVRSNDDRGVDDLMAEIDHLFVHSAADANVQKWAFTVRRRFRPEVLDGEQISVALVVHV
jgi:hypothetical protein